MAVSAVAGHVVQGASAAGVATKTAASVAEVQWHMMVAMVAVAVAVGSCSQPVQAVSVLAMAVTRAAAAAAAQAWEEPYSSALAL